MRLRNGRPSSRGLSDCFWDIGNLCDSGNGGTRHSRTWIIHDYYPDLNHHGSHNEGQQLTADDDGRTGNVGS